MPLALVLPLPASVAARLALPADVPGALPAEDLHLTLAVMVDGAEPPLDEARALAAELTPVVATLSGLGRFSGDEADAFHATVDGPALPALCARVEALLGSRLDTTHGFDPHVTLAYLAADAPAPLARLAPTPVTFDALALWDGATRTTFPLTVPTMTTATLDAIALPRDPPTELRLFRDGWNATVKGRFLLDAQGAAEILRRFAEHGVELAMDFDHATFAGAPGAKRDVPGYIAGLDYRPGDGLYATGLRWTAIGLAAITPGRAPDGTPTVPEYRYLSPAVDFDADTRRVVGLRPVALVTYPATHGQAPLVMSAGATPSETRTMKNVLALLGLAADADESAAVAALQTVRRERDALLGALDAPDLASALGTAAAWRTSRTALDAAEKRATDAEGRIEAAERREVLAAGKAEGKLTPALAAHFEGKPVAEIRAYLAAAPVITALAGRTAPTPQPSPATAPTALAGVPDTAFETLSALEKDRLLRGNRLAFEQKLADFEARGGDGTRYRAALARVTG